MSQVTVIRSVNAVGWSLLVIIGSFVVMLLVTFGLPGGAADTNRPDVVMAPSDTGDWFVSPVEGRVVS